MERTMSADWKEVALAYLHDPPDKALDLTGHVARAARYASAALGLPVETSQLKHVADAVASVAERLPAPDWRVLTMRPENSTLLVRHPLGGGVSSLPVGAVDEGWVREQVEGLVAGLPEEAEPRFLAVWRLLPERLADGAHPWFAHLPADTRVPDHTIWHHLDITAGLRAAGVGEQGAAFLSFALGPVQRFIEAARTVRDLWSGSMLLSWLAFQAMRPVIEEYGPTALVYPSLRGVPLLDLWLREEKGLRGVVKELDERRRRAPCLPHRFLAVVPWGPDGETARKLAEACKERASAAWHKVADAVRAQIAPTLAALDPVWDRLWEEQIGAHLELQAAVLPWRACTDEVAARLLADGDDFAAALPAAGAVRKMAAAIPPDQQPGYSQQGTGAWQARVELSAHLMEAERAVRHVPPYKAESRVPAKCSMFGSYEQMGPAEFGASARFWHEAARKLSVAGVRLRERERLSAVALVKRFSGPCHLAGELGLSRDDLRIDDTATIAAVEWLERAGIKPSEMRQLHPKKGWSGQWIHWPHPAFDADDECPTKVWEFIEPARGRRDLGKPPTYYAILVMDGDDLGGWLRGDKSPQVREVMHPEVVRYFESLGEATGDGLNAKRPVGPALHAAISSALANFALHVAPEVVARHNGVLVYSGGDDTLALLPTSRALDCAKELRDAYTKPYYRKDGRDFLMMGPKATLSAGLTIVHYKEDLRQALATARAAEKRVKEVGRDALQITACRRSGEQTTTLCPWPYLDRVAELVKNFLPQHGEPGASDRWAYHLAGERHTLAGLSAEAMRAEIRRRVDRADERTRRLLGRDSAAGAGDAVARAFKEYLGLVSARSPALAAGPALADFVTLCQTASFLARGRDR
jgi:CRISPR-associated protein Cmr2